MKSKTLCAHIAQALLTLAAIGMLVLQQLRDPAEHSIYLGHTIFHVSK